MAAHRTPRCRLCRQLTARGPTHGRPEVKTVINYPHSTAIPAMAQMRAIERLPHAAPASSNTQRLATRPHQSPTLASALSVSSP